MNVINPMNDSTSILVTENPMSHSAFLNCQFKYALYFRKNSECKGLKLI